MEEMSGFDILSLNPTEYHQKLSSPLLPTFVYIFFQRHVHPEGMRRL